ncbi:MAG: hypothetical protein PHU01_12130, partial [Desulfuromonadaceae bacterium]|nr:hypothetical protein [Desulfuromonadaceae bacterium]
NQSFDDLCDDMVGKLRTATNGAVYNASSCYCSYPYCKLFYDKTPKGICYDNLLIGGWSCQSRDGIKYVLRFNPDSDLITEYTDGRSVKSYYNASNGVISGEYNLKYEFINSDKIKFTTETQFEYECTRQ